MEALGSAGAGEGRAPTLPGGLEVKHLPAMQETWVQSLGREGPLE